MIDLTSQRRGTCASRFDSSGRVELSELTWEQKERVLRYLFARMNGARDRRARPLQAALSDSVVPSLREKQAW